MLPFAPMDEHAEIEALKALVGLLWRQVEQATLTAETLRELLQQHGTLTSVEIEAKLAEGRAIQQASMIKTFRKGLDAYQQEMLRRILERYEGPEH